MSVINALNPKTGKYEKIPMIGSDGKGEVAISDTEPEPKVPIWINPSGEPSGSVDINFVSGDDKNPEEYTDVPLIANNEPTKSFREKVSTMVKNVRYLLKMIGNTDITAVGNGTLTGAVDELNKNNYDIIAGGFGPVSSGDTIQLTRKVRVNSVVLMAPYHNTNVTMRCNYDAQTIVSGSDSFQLYAWDTNMNTEATANNLYGRYIIVPIK